MDPISRVFRQIIIGRCPRWVEFWNKRYEECFGVGVLCRIYCPGDSTRHSTFVEYIGESWVANWRVLVLFSERAHMSECIEDTRVLEEWYCQFFSLPNTISLKSPNNMGLGNSPHLKSPFHIKIKPGFWPYELTTRVIPFLCQTKPRIALCHLTNNQV